MSIRIHCCDLKKSFFLVILNQRQDISIHPFKRHHKPSKYFVLPSKKSALLCFVADINFLMFLFSLTSGTISPVHILHRLEPPFFQRLYVMVPLCAVLVILVVSAVAVGLYCRRRYYDLKCKGTKNCSQIRKVQINKLAISLCSAISSFKIYCFNANWNF